MATPMSEGEQRASAIDPAIVERAAEATWREAYRLSTSGHVYPHPDGWSTWPSFQIDRDYYRILAIAALQEAIPEAVRAERNRVLSSLGFPRAYRKFKTPCAAMSETQLDAEDSELDAVWKCVVADEEGGAGSPGEWVVERSGEIDAERSRRARGVAKGEGNG